MTIFKMEFNNMPTIYDIMKKLENGETQFQEGINPKHLTRTQTIDDLFKFGRPCGYHNTVDPHHRVSHYLRTKMNTIDLIPCYYTIGTEFIEEQKKDFDISGLLPEIDYNDSIKRFKKQCDSYGLGEYSGLRLYTTDDTTATDSITNSLTDNFLQQGVNKASQIGKKIGSLAQSVGAAEVGRKVTNQVSDRASEEVNERKGSVAEQTGLNQKDGGQIASATNTAKDIAMDVILKGHQMSLPQIWDNSDYSPNLSVTTKLVSPYGHPKAINEFVIKPLTYLLILTSSKTRDGVSYGRPFFLTINAYGLSYSPIGLVSNITLRRGGNDTSFNIYKQPLSIDVTLDFQFAVKGFAGYEPSEQTTNDDIATVTSNESISYNDAESSKASAGKTCVLPTIGKIIHSLRPVKPEYEIEYENNYFYPFRNTKPMPDHGESTKQDGISQEKLSKIYPIHDMVASDIDSGSVQTAKKEAKDTIKEQSENIKKSANADLAASDRSQETDEQDNVFYRDVAQNGKKYTTAGYKQNAQDELNEQIENLQNSENADDPAVQQAIREKQDELDDLNNVETVSDERFAKMYGDAQQQMAKVDDAIGDMAGEMGNFS